MASKIAAAKIAAWSGVRAVIARRRPRRRAARRGRRACPASAPSCCRATARLPARKLWIAFAVGVQRHGRRRRRRPPALLERRACRCSPPASSTVDGRFDADDAVEVAGPDGKVFAKGLVRMGASMVSRGVAGRRSSQLPEGTPHEVIHRDDLVARPLADQDDADRCVRSIS